MRQQDRAIRSGRPVCRGESFVVVSAIACLILVLLGVGDLSADQIYLDQLDLSRVASGWNSLGIKRSIGGRPLTIDGKVYARGVGVHPPSRIAVEARGKTIQFHAQVGVDDEVGSQRGTVEFRVYGDGRELWKSGLVSGRDRVKTIDVNLRGVHRIELIVTSAGRYSTTHSDHADWANAYFEYDTIAPRTESYPQRYPLVDEPRARIQALRREIATFHTSPSRRRYWDKVTAEVVHPASRISPQDRDPLDVLLRRTSALLEHLKHAASAGTEAYGSLAARAHSRRQSLRVELEELRKTASRTPVSNGRARDLLCRRVLAVRRRIALTNPRLDFDTILFIKRYPLPGHHAAGHNICDQYFGFHAVPGGGLFLLANAFSDGDAPKVHNVLQDSICENGRFAGKMLRGGTYLSPDLSFDGQTILFAWTDATPRRYIWDEKTTFAIYRVDVDGLGLRQLTAGAYNDFDPCWLPNDRIAFISERRGGNGRCHGRPVPTYTLHTMLAGGHDIVCISPHETNEWHPSVDNSGRILYTRWDYVDRGDIQAHHPWIIAPDGRNPRAVHGNYRHSPESSPCAELDLRAIPNSTKYLGTAAPHHGQAYGTLIQVDTRILDDDRRSQVRRFTPEVSFPQPEQGGPIYATPWPLDEYFCLCVYDDQANAVDAVQSNYGIYLVDAFGNKELLYRDSHVPCLSPIPLRPRRKPIVQPHYTSIGPPETQGGFQPKAPSRRTAPVSLLNVYDSLLPFPEGEQIHSLRILQLVPKTTASANMPRIGHGSQKNARRVLGTVPVAADGSAFFEVPVGVPIYFQALDSRERAVQSMRSDTYAFSGRGITCQGCHEPRHHVPDFGRRGPAMAFRRRAARIEPDVLGSNPLNYPLLVQPVLDRHCVGCHGGKPGDAAPDLRRGDPQRHPRHWFTSYDGLKPYAFFHDDQVFTAPRTTPGQFGARASRLLGILDQGHYGVKLSNEDLHRIILWLDCNSDFFGAYESPEAQAAGRIVLPSLD